MAMNAEYHACKRLQDRLNYLFGIGLTDKARITVEPSLLVLAQREKVMNRTHQMGIVGCEIEWLPKVCQYGVDGSQLVFPLLLATRKGNSLEGDQIRVINSLIMGNYTEPIAATTFYYPTGAVMAVVFHPVDLANLLFSYVLEKEPNHA